VSDGIKAINDEISKLNWQISHGGGDAAYYLEMYNQAMAIADWPSAGNYLAQWYSAAKAAAYAAAQAAASQGQVADAFLDLLEAIEDTILNIETSDLNLAVPKVKFEEVTQDYEKLKAEAMSGDATAAQDFMSFASEYLGLAKDAYKSSTDYQDIYSSVLADLEALKSVKFKAPSSTPSSSPSVEPNYSDINAMFKQLSDALIKAMTAWNNEIYLKIDWENYEGTMTEALEMLLSIVNEYGWKNKITLEWINDMAQWMAETKSIEEVLFALGFIVDETGWTSTATLTFIASVTAALAEMGDIQGLLKLFGFILEAEGWEAQATLTFIASVTAVLAAQGDLENLAILLGFIVDSTGWHSTATLTFIRTFAGAWDFKSLEEIWDFLNLLGKNEDGTWRVDVVASFLLGLKDQYGVSFTDIQTWLKTMGIEDSIIQEIMLNLAFQEGSTSGFTTPEEVAAYVQSVMNSLGITDVDKWIKLFIDIAAQGGLLTGLDTPAKVLEYVTEVMNSLGITDVDKWIDAFVKVTAYGGGLEGLDSLYKIKAYADDLLDSLGIDDLDIKRSLEISLIYNLVSSGDIDVAAAADWAYAEYIAAMTAATVTERNKLAASAEQLGAMFGVHKAWDYGYYIGALSPQAQAAGFTGTAAGDALYAVYKDWGRPQTWAEGTIATSPQLGWIAEAGYPEAVIPMKDGYNIPVKWINGGSNGKETTTNERPIYITVEVAGKEFYTDVQRIAINEADKIRVKADRRKMNSQRII